MLFHIHDYEMIFNDGDKSLNLNYKLRCECGDVAPDMGTALRRMTWSRWRFIFMIATVAALAVAMVWFIGVALLVLL